MPSKKSVARHLADGTFKAYRHGSLRKPAQADDVKPPPHLTDLERDAFELIVAYLHHASVSISFLDVFAIERCALALVDAQEARAEVRKLPSRTVKTNYSDQSLHPLVKLEMNAWAAFMEAAKGLGMNPKERESLSLGDVAEVDPLDELDQRRQTRGA